MASRSNLPRHESLFARPAAAGAVAALRGDSTIPEVGELFGVSATFVNKMLRLHRAGDDLTPRPHGGGHTPRLGPRHHKLLRSAVASNNDATLGELREHLTTRAGVTVSEATVSRALSRLGLPRKNKHEGGGAQQL
jgi:transposase